MSTIHASQMVPDDSDFQHGVMLSWILEYACKYNHRTLFSAIGDDPRIIEANPQVAKRAKLHNLLDDVEDMVDEDGNDSMANRIARWKLVLFDLEDIIAHPDFADILPEFTQISMKIRRALCFWSSQTGAGDPAAQFNASVVDLLMPEGGGSELQNEGVRLTRKIHHMQNPALWLASEAKKASVSDVRKLTNLFIRTVLFPRVSTEKIQFEKFYEQSIEGSETQLSQEHSVVTEPLVEAPVLPAPAPSRKSSRKGASPALPPLDMDDLDDVVPVPPSPPILPAPVPEVTSSSSKKSKKRVALDDLLEDDENSPPVQQKSEPVPPPKISEPQSPSRKSKRKAVHVSGVTVEVAPAVTSKERSGRSESKRKPQVVAFAIKSNAMSDEEENPEPQVEPSKPSKKKQRLEEITVVDDGDEVEVEVQKQSSPRSQKALDSLKRKSETLRKTVGDDPLDFALADTRIGSRPASKLKLTDRHPSAGRVSPIVDDDEVESRPQLPSFKAKPIEALKPKATAPQSAPPSGTGQRRPWSEEEILNLHKGMKQFGKDWAAIRTNYKFNNRSNVDIKDKWRNIEKKLRSA